MDSSPTALPKSYVQQQVALAIAEDIGDGDITAALLPGDLEVKADVITREYCVISGRAWVDEVFRALDERCVLTWHKQAGERAEPNQRLFSVTGPARSLLTAE